MGMKPAPPFQLDVPLALMLFARTKLSLSSVPMPCRP